MPPPGQVPFWLLYMFLRCTYSFVFTALVPRGEGREMHIFLEIANQPTSNKYLNTCLQETPDVFFPERQLQTRGTIPPAQRLCFQASFSCAFLMEGPSSPGLAPCLCPTSPNCQVPPGATLCRLWLRESRCQLFL